MRTKSTLALIALASVVSAADAREDAIVETATLGPASEDGWGLSSTQHLGARFFVEETAEVTGIGGHLAGAGRLFGAIVRLEDARAVPPPAPFGPALVEQVTFEPPESDEDVLVDLAATLEPGHYAVVFGSGAFGASGVGRVPWAGQKDLFGASYLVWLQGQWRDSETLGIRFRVVTDPPCPGDIDGSADVGMPDLLIVLAEWGPCPDGCAPDLNGDEIVDFEDLLILLGGWGPCE